MGLHVASRQRMPARTQRTFLSKDTICDDDDKTSTKCCGTTGTNSQIKHIRFSQAVLIIIQYIERERDYLITKTNPIYSKISHIYPLSTKDTTMAEIETFWRTFRIFWNEERLSVWWQLIYGDQLDTEKVQNVICLNPDAHVLHGMGTLV